MAGNEYIQQVRDFVAEHGRPPRYASRLTGTAEHKLRDKIQKQVKKGRFSEEERRELAQLFEPSAPAGGAAKAGNGPRKSAAAGQVPAVSASKRNYSAAAASGLQAGVVTEVVAPATPAVTCCLRCATVLDFEAAASAATEGEAIPSDLTVMGLEELSAAGLKPDDAKAAMEDGCGEAVAAECESLIVAELGVAALEMQVEAAVGAQDFERVGALQSELRAARTVAALQAQLRGAVQSEDYVHASELQSELRAARDAARRRLRMRKVAAAFRCHTQFDDAIIENIASFVLPLV